MNDDAKRESVAGASRFKAVKISVVVSPPRDGGAIPEDAVKRGNLLRRLSLRSRGRSEVERPSQQMDEVQLAQSTRLQEKIKRQARTHSLLVSIVVVFALSWFPLNVLNIVLDVKGDIFQVEGVIK